MSTILLLIVFVVVAVILFRYVAPSVEPMIRMIIWIVYALALLVVLFRMAGIHVPMGVVFIPWLWIFGLWYF